MAFRGCIPDFQLANPLYVGATATFYTVNPDGTASSTLAILYADPTSTTTVVNPQTLDSDGKFAAPVYIETPVIAQVQGPNVESHTTGVINARGTWRGVWAADTIYFSTDFVVSSAGLIYAAALDYTSSSSITTDINAGNLVLVMTPELQVSPFVNPILNAPWSTGPSLIHVDGAPTANGSPNAVLTASISGTTLTVESLSSGTLSPGMTIYGYKTGSIVLVSGSGSTWTIQNNSLSIPVEVMTTSGGANITASIVGSVLYVDAINTGSLNSGDTLSGDGIPSNVTLGSNLGAGLNIWSVINASLSISSEAMVGQGTWLGINGNSTAYNEFLTGIDTNGNSISRSITTLSISWDGQSVPGWTFGEGGGDIPPWLFVPDAVVIGTPPGDLGGTPGLIMYSGSAQLNEKFWFVITDPSGNFVLQTCNDNINIVGSETQGVLTISRTGVKAVDTILATPLQIGMAAWGTFQSSGTLPANNSNLSFGGASVTASITSATMTVTAVGSGVLGPGQTLTGSPTSLTSGTTIVSQVTPLLYGESTGGIGRYTVNHSQSVSSETIAAASTTVTFVSGTPVGNEVAIGSTMAATLANLYNFFAASTDPNLSMLTYVADTETVVTVTFGTSSVVGNNYKISAGGTSNFTASGSTLAQGGGFILSVGGGINQPTLDENIFNGTINANGGIRTAATSFFGTIFVDSNVLIQNTNAPAGSQIVESYLDSSGVYHIANLSAEGSFYDAIQITSNAGSELPGTVNFPGPFTLSGSSSGAVTVAAHAAAGTYNFNLPITAGSSGQVLTSAGGNSTAMTWSTPVTVAGANTWTAAQTFDNSDILLLGSSTGATTFTSANASATNYTITFPAATDTLALLAATQTLTNKTIAFASNTLTGVAPLASPTFTGVVGTPAGSATAPALAIGGGTTGLYSVSTTGFGIAINGVDKLDYNNTNAGFWTATGGLLATGTIQGNLLIVSNGAEFVSNYLYAGTNNSSQTGFLGGSATVFGWTAGSGSTSSTALDTGFCRASSGVVNLGDGSGSDTSGTLNLTNLSASSGIKVGAATGGNLGNGTINVYGGIYLNNTAYTNPDYVFEHHFTGAIEKFADKPRAKDYRGLMALPDLEAHIRDTLRLPGITDRPTDIFERGDIALEKLEEHTLYILALHKRIAELETRCG